jgi:hypothetical protein
LPQGFTKVPWGFTQTNGGLVANSSTKDRNERMELGEFAILLFDKMGVDADRLKIAMTSPDPFDGVSYLSRKVDFPLW